VINLILIGQNHLYVNMFFNRDFAIQKCSRVSALFASQEKSVPWQLSGRLAIPSGRSSIHSSSRLDDMPFRPDTRQTKHHSSGRCGFCPDPPLYREASIPACIRPDVSATRSDDVRWSISFRFSFQVQIREDWCNRPDDVDSRPDALIHKARIAIQIQPFERLPIMVRTSANQIWKLRVEDQPSELPSPLVRTREALYGNYLQ